MLPRSKKGQLVAVSVGIWTWELPSYIDTMAEVSTDVTSIPYVITVCRTVPSSEWNHGLTCIQQGYLPPIEGHTKRIGC